MTGCSCGDCNLCCHPYPDKATKEWAERLAAERQNIAPSFNPLGAGDKTPEPALCAAGFHKWTVWSAEKLMETSYISRTAGIVKNKEMRQERTCLKCNKIESRSSL